MSGIYIPGMEMPTNCGECEFCICYVLDDGTEENYRCPITMYPIHNFDERHERCPLVPVPEHGRLIDADALKSDGFYTIVCYTGKMPYEYTAMRIDDAPTIIPAEEG